MTLLDFIFKREKNAPKLHLYELETLGGFQVTCRLKNDCGELEVSYDEDNCLYSRDDIMKAVDVEIMSDVRKYLDSIGKGK